MFLYNWVFNIKKYMYYACMEMSYTSSGIHGYIKVYITPSLRLQATV